MLKSYIVLSLGAVLLSGPCSGADFFTGQAARAVIGQPTFTAQMSGASDTLLGAVGAVTYAANTLFVADSNRLGFLPNNNRVLIFNNLQQMLPASDAEILPFSGRCPVCVGKASVVVGQPDFATVAATPVTQSSMRLPTAVASDGHILAVADTSNNRILIWKSIPATNGQPADIVLGQPDFTTVGRLEITASALRGPQGVWVQNGKLFVADTQNNRVLIWNSIPTRNNQPADLVLGQPNFTTSPPLNQVTALTASASTMLSPTSVTSDGTRLYVSDLGFNRVLIWNSIPTSTQQPANVVIGQKDFSQSFPNDSTDLCASNGTDTNGNATFPALCGATLSFPRYALSDGQRLFIADGGNNRVLVFNSIPTLNGAKADAVLGQPDEFSDVVSNDRLVVSAANITPTPTSLAWDGQNLYVADAKDYRVLVFSPGRPDVPLDSILNGASRAVYATGSVGISGTITEKNTATITINGTAYTYTVKANDTLDGITQALTALINAPAKPDPNVLATQQKGFSIVRLVARQPGTNGNNITLTTSTSANATIVLTTSGVTLSGGGNAAIIAGGSVILVRGTNLADTSASASPDGVTLPENLPFELAGVQLYFDGLRAPLFSVSPTEIKAQFPFLAPGESSLSSWIRIKHADGSVTVTTAVNVGVIDQSAGIFADETPGAQEPRAAIAVHASSFSTGTVTVGLSSGAIGVGDTGTITIGGTPYSYTVVTDDTLTGIRDKFIAIINADPDSPVTASAAVSGTNIRLTAKVPGPAGDGITIAGSATTTATSGVVQLTLTPTNTVLCCANVAGTPITEDNPALPGETIIVYATGLGLITPDEAKLAILDGAKYRGPAVNAPRTDVSATLGVSATVISASLLVGQIGVYQIVLEIGPTATPDPQAQLTITQAFNPSNIVVVPLGSPPSQSGVPPAQ